MAAFEEVEIGSRAFGLRLANLLVASRAASGRSVGAMAKASGGRFAKSDLKAFEAGTRTVDETTIDELATLYGCDLGEILPLRLPVVVSANRVSAGGVHQDVAGDGPDQLLAAYLILVRTLRRQRKTPVVDLRRGDIEVLAGFLHEPQDSVVQRLAGLMRATQTKRTAMVAALTTGAAVIGLVGTAAAVSVGDAPANGTPETTVVEATSPATSTTVADTEPTTSTTSTTSTTTTAAPTTTVAPTTTATTIAVTSPPPPPSTQRPPATTVRPTTTVPSIETNLTTTSVGTGEPPIPTLPGG